MTSILIHPNPSNGRMSPDPGIRKLKKHFAISSENSSAWNRKLYQRAVSQRREDREVT
jgi:hypothetical protein